MNSKGKKNLIFQVWYNSKRSWVTRSGVQSKNRTRAVSAQQQREENPSQQAAGGAPNMQERPRGVPNALWTSRKVREWFEGRITVVSFDVCLLPFSRSISFGIFSF